MPQFLVEVIGGEWNDMIRLPYRDFTAIRMQMELADFTVFLQQIFQDLLAHLIKLPAFYRRMSEVEIVTELFFKSDWVSLCE